MAGRIDGRLAELGIALPDVAAPLGNYVPFVVSASLVFISGQIPMEDGAPRYVGRLGDGMDTDAGRQAARLCGVNLLAQLRAACDGDLDKVSRVVKLTGYVNCTAEFTDQPQVLNGASDLMVEVFGDRGRHARAVMGCAALPMGLAVEVEGIFQLG